MKILKISFIFIVIVPLSFSLSISQVINQVDELEIAAREFVNNLAAGEFEKATENFDSTMKSVAPPEKMAEVWNSFTSQIGKFKKQLGVRSEKFQQYDIYFVTCEFENANYDIKVVFDPSKKIAGQFFVPPKQDYDFAPPDYALKDLFEEKEVTVGSGEWALQGTLTLPDGDGQFPAVVLVHGSGPNDRDETLGPNKPFRDIAWGLASNGIAVLRYDKRTRVYQSKMAALANTLTAKEEVIDDALLAVELLRGIDKIDAKKIFVIGHSLGGTMLPRIGTSDPEIAGFVMLAGSPRPLEDLYLEQMIYILRLDGDLSDEERKLLEDIKLQVLNVKSLSVTHDIPAEDLPMGVPAAYWDYFKSYQPIRECKELKQPMLILAGQRDYQVTKADYKIWQEGLSSNKNIRFKSYLKLNHLFMEGEGTPAPSDYEIPGHVDKAVITDIVEWIKDPSAGSKSKK